MSADYTNMIDTLIVNNLVYLDQIYKINDKVDELLLSGTSNEQQLLSLQDAAQIINKKIKDNCATINDLNCKTYVPQSFFDNILLNFNKKALYISDTLPSSFTHEDIIVGLVVFQNQGMFYSWTDDKNIKLRIRIYNDSDDMLLEDITSLDTVINIPGDANQNTDYLTNKTFDVSFTAPVIPGVHSVTYEIIDDTDTYLDSFKKTIDIV